MLRKNVRADLFIGSFFSLSVFHTRDTLLSQTTWNVTALCGLDSKSSTTSTFLILPKRSSLTMTFVCPFSQFPRACRSTHEHHRSVPFSTNALFEQQAVSELTWVLFCVARPQTRMTRSSRLFDKRFHWCASDSQTSFFASLFNFSSISTSLILCSFPRWAAHTLLTLLVVELILRLFLSKVLGSFSWLLSLCLGRTWPDSQTARPRAECAWPALSGRESSARSCGQKRQWDRRGRSREWSRSDRLGTAGARTGETWEGRRWDEREIWHAHATNTWDLSHACVFTCIRVCEVRSERAVRRKMCVQQVSVCTHTVVHTVVATTLRVRPLQLRSRKQKSSLHDHFEKILQFVVWVRNPLKNSQTSSFHVRLDLSYWYLSISWLFINHCEWTLLGFPKHASLRDRPS